MSKDVKEVKGTVVDAEATEVESVPKVGFVDRVKTYTKEHGLLVGALAGATATLWAIIGYNVLSDESNVIDGEFTEEDAE